MMDASLEQALNEQLNREIFSSYLYLSMAAHFESAGFPGLASWMRAQADEEHLHAMRFFDHINDRGARVLLASGRGATVGVRDATRGVRGVARA